MSSLPDDQEFCLKWNNHKTTLLSVMDNLLEEESLVDVTLSADGQFIRAHRIILSASSPYFRELFLSSFLDDSHPVVILKDVEFDNLKSLVEYMYKGEANVPECKLSSFIQTAELLQIRGLAEGANKLKLEQITQTNKLQNLMDTNLTIPLSPENVESRNTGFPKYQEDESANSVLLKEHLSMVENFPFHMKNYQEKMASVMKKLGKTLLPQEVMAQRNIVKDYDLDFHAIDKEVNGQTKNNNTDDIVGINDDGDNSEEELIIEEKDETGFVNPWTGEDMRNMADLRQQKAPLYDNLALSLGMTGSSNYVQDLKTYPLIGKDIKSPTNSDSGSPTNRLKRLTNTDSVYTLCPTPEGPKFQCVMCSRIFNLKCTLLRHVRHQHQGRFVPHPCKACGQVFKRSDHLKVHLKKIHNIVQDKSNLITP